MQTMNPFLVNNFFLYPLSQQKICGFLILSGIIKGLQCGMEWKNVLTCLLHVCNATKIYQKDSSFYPLAKSHLKESQ